MPTNIFEHLHKTCSRCKKPFPSVILKNGRAFCPSCWKELTEEYVHIFSSENMLYRADLLAMASECSCGLVYIWVTDEEWQDQRN